MKRLRALLVLLLVVSAGYVIYKIVPPYFANYQFQDVIQSEARNNSYGAVRKNEDELRDFVVKKAVDLDIPLRPEQVKITRNGFEWVISCDYTVHVDLPIHPVDLEFHPTSKETPIAK